jgi:2-polyprenyl-3-methyl-5-hydroxy-6-metoxy-1,4-benzoquinol methylase
MRRTCLSEFRCTNCGSDLFSTVDRKYLLTSLRRCARCRLMYRIPTDDQSANFRYYQKTYRQGFTTELPKEKDLERLLETNFEGAERCYRYYISVLQHLGLRKGARIFDFGCSWGYGSWQLRQAGYEVWACEISQPRALFASEKLGIQCTSEISEHFFDANSLRGSFDCFFSAHVLEHVPSPRSVIELAKIALRPNGLFVALTPNGSKSFKEKSPKSWHFLWGKTHPNLIDDEYYRCALSGHKIYLDTSPVNSEALGRFADGNELPVPELSGGELLCVGKLGVNTW